MLNTKNIWKKILYLFLITITLFILDNTIVTFFKFKGVYPSILFAFIICYSIINGYEEAIILGVISGYLQDIFFPGVLGINMFANLVLCVLAARIGKSIFKEKILIPAMSTFLVSVLKSGIIYLLLIFIGSKNDFLHLIIYKAVYEMIVTFISYKLILKFSETKTMKKEWRF